ncbi:K(+)-transporting ATPase subunit C [Solicola sp. PLA-1-18]|uniref:K(+)-transporting ATPase subunit C n=1 Tax=Solicola sp. PLA-1-18 TaxID=3380532 RepID=UPI003B8148D5
MTTTTDVVARPSTATLLTDLVRQSWTGLRALLVLTVLLGVVYPVTVWAVGQVALGDRADGQLVRRDGAVVGSALIGQRFDAETAPGLFHSRPSAGDYDPLATAPSNLGPSDPDLVRTIEERRAQVARDNGVAPSAVPPDAVTASGSGVDPYVSPAYAALQVDRVARASGLTVGEVRTLVAEHTRGRSLGFLGDPKVDVLRLNLAVLDATR